MVFLHPVHNFALIAYDPSALGVAGASVVRAAELLPGSLTFRISSPLLSFSLIIFLFLFFLGICEFDHSYYFIMCVTFIIYQTEPALRRGDSVYLVGLSRSLQATSRKSIVTNPCAALNISSADCPRYRAMNMEVIELDTGKAANFA